MSKDPAFLFYSSDFYMGTAFMSDEQVGQYIRLLCLQHQHGRLSEAHMLSICKAYDEKIFSKFIKDENGAFFNKRLEDEVVRRNKYCEGRRQNKLKDPHMSTHMSSHMSTHMEAEAGTVNEDRLLKKRDKTNIQQVVEYYKTLLGYDKIDNWDSVHFARHTKHARDILAIVKTVQTALTCIEWTKKTQEDRKLNWNLSTVAKMAPDFLKSANQTQELTASEKYVKFGHY